MSITWDAANAAHLLRRAGFVASPKAVAVAVKKGQSKTIAALFKRDKKQDKLPKHGIEGVDRLRTHWVKKMLSTKSPLVEKMTLLLHNHFATAISKVGSTTYMLEHVQMLRKGCFGSFRDLVTNVSKDVAMLIWLDNKTNVDGNPNENYARELMELFTTGVLDASGTPNYTETDVQESARAFTGWGTTWHDDREWFQFNDWDHDYGTKTFRGITGNLDGTDVIENLVTDEATARRLAMKLWSYFAYDVGVDAPELDALAAAYLANDTRIQPMLIAMFSSDAFYGDAAKGTHVKGPIEWTVNALLLTKTKVNKNDDVELGYLPTDLGQEPFNPPSVFGWDEGLAWVGVGGLLGRARAAQEIAGARDKDGSIQFDPRKLLGSPKKFKKFTPEQTLDQVLAQLGSLAIAPTTRTALLTYLAPPVGETFVLDDDTIDTKVRGLVALLLSSPEFQVQ